MQENIEKIDINSKNVKNSYFHENKLQCYKNQNYALLKNECLQSKNLFYDTTFTPTDQNIYYSKPIPRGIRWLV